MILIDASSVFMSSIMANVKDYRDKPELIRHTIFNVIRSFNLRFRQEYGEMIICLDSKNTWRRQYFPEYKAARRKNRKEDKHDWTAIYEIFDKTKEELINYSPFKTIAVEGCEADDIIGTICERSSSPEPILIISPDKDFIQLQRYPNVKQFSNIQKKWLHPEKSPELDLEEKVLRGDSGDGVPNVMSDDDVFASEGKRQTPLGAKKLKMLMEDPESLGTTVARRIIRNRTLVDLTRTPSELKDEIIDKLNSDQDGSISTLVNLFIKNRMNLLLEDLTDFEINRL